MREENPCGAPLGLSVLIEEICKTGPLMAEKRMRQNNLVQGFSKQGPHTSGSLQALLRDKRGQNYFTNNTKILFDIFTVLRLMAQKQ